MARSVGEAAALGLEAGYRIASDAQERAQRHEREARLDAQTTEQLHYTRGRQENADAVTALDAQAKQLALEGAAGHATPQAQEEYTRRVEALNARRNQLLGGVSGVDVGKVREQGLNDIKALQEGKVEGVNLTRAAVVATNRPHTDFVRQNGQPSVIEQAGEDFMNGMENKDEKTMLKGVNVMYAPALQKGIGSKNQHGTIVGKEIIGLDHDPRSHPDDPHFVPRLRVYVNSGKELRGPLPEGVPKGATGYYDAPMTKNRSSDPGDPVQSVGLQEALDFMHINGQFVELMNTPEAQAKLQQEAQKPEFDPQQYLSALASVGAAGGKKTTSYHNVPNGGMAIATTTDAKGNEVKREIIQGNEKTFRDPYNPMQRKIDAIRALATEDGGNVLTEDEAEAKIKALVDKDTTRAPRAAGKGGGGGGEGGSSGKIHKTEKDGEGYLIGVFKDGSTKRLLIDGKPVRSQDFEKRIDKLAHDMSTGLGGLGKSAEELRQTARDSILKTVDAEKAAAPAPAAAPAKKTLKFDKNGDPVK